MNRGMFSSYHSASSVDACDSCFGHVGSRDPFKPPINLLTCASCKRVKYCSKVKTLIFKTPTELKTLTVARNVSELRGRSIISRSAYCMHQ